MENVLLLGDASIVARGEIKTSKNGEHLFVFETSHYVNVYRQVPQVVSSQGLPVFLQAYRDDPDSKDLLSI